MIYKKFTIKDTWEGRYGRDIINSKAQNSHLSAGIYLLWVGKHPWLSMYIQGLFLNEKESLIPNDCHCSETNCTGYDPNVLVSTRK